MMAAVLLSSPVFSASKKKKKTKTEEPVQVETQEAVAVDDTSYKLPAGKNQREYFSKIDPEVLLGVQNGSPDSLREAMSRMRQKSSDYEESQKVLAVVAAEIMKLVWPAEKVSWEIPEVTEDNPYTGAISSVRQGVFDSSTGNVDFLSTLLPALVVINTTDSAIFDSCEKALASALQLQPDSVLHEVLQVPQF